MLRFRNASDSQLAAKAKQQAAAEKPPPVPRPPDIITTAPTMDMNVPRKKPSRLRLSRFRKSGEMERVPQDESALEPTKKDRRKTLLLGLGGTSGTSKQSVHFEEPRRPSSSQHSPPAYGDDNGSSLALPVNRLSESSRSDASSGDRVYGSTTTTTHTVHTTTTFFRLPRRKHKQPEPLFPISHLQRGPSAGEDSNASVSSLAPSTADSSRPSPSRIGPAAAGGQQTPTPSRPSTGNEVSTPSAPSPALALFTKSNPSPATALFRPSSRNSGQSSPTRAALHLRGRSSTMSSVGRGSPRPSVDEHPTMSTTRTSTSAGRKSFGDLLGLSRLRQPSEPPGRGGSLTPATPGSSASKNNSLQLTRDSVVLPERRDDDTPAKYLERLLEVVSRSVIAAAVSKGTDTFSQSVLRSYMRGFKFFGDPMDMAIRKLLMEAELPKETQQIDRCLQAFANRYHECNPGVYSSPDQAYFIAFSLLILHTDVFNKNNKHKMQKTDYLKNTRGEGIFDEILEVFYDNISYTPFIHVEDDLDINGERIIAHKAKKKSIFNGAAPDPAKRAHKEPIDPYTLIIDNKLDILRPNLGDVMHLEDHYSYMGTANGLNLKELQKTFFKTGVLQIVSARSRPDAFMTEKTATNPEEAHPGIVDIKITKVGILWRKDAKKKKTRSPWQEWGAILTGAQLYFFRNTAWIKNLMHQYDEHVRKGHDADPCTFKPPLDQFKPDALISTDGAVALLDSTYKRHKHAFVYVRHGGFEEVLLAEDEQEMNDWLAKLNYAAAFRSSGVRMRGVVGGGYDGQGRRAIRSADNGQSVQTPSGEVKISRSKIDHKMVQDILAARRDIMLQKVSDANEKLQEAEKSLESQLRNSRHLQILAPIQPKTREQMLLSAARMAAQLKWTRMEIWRLKCHRDILLMDLEEERQLLGGDESILEGTPIERLTARDESNAGVATAPKSPRSPATFLTFPSTAGGARSDTEDSPVTEVFQTPPTSATAPSFHRHQNSWELPNLAFDDINLRKTSVSSGVSSHHSATATSSRNIASSSSAPEKSKVEEGEDIDANERDMLEQAGIDAHALSRSPDSKAASSALESEDVTETRSRGLNGSSVDRHDRNKIRRSLQRTLRESAGHLHHHRSRRGRDAGPNGVLADEPTKDEVLARGTGSFTVHGKKASVIMFGNELQMQNLSPDERIRQRKQRDEANSPASATGEASNEPAPDFRAILTQASEPTKDREHRDSAASASTATARSFRELHRKYSSAQAARAMTSNPSLVVPSDEDSDAAISFSDGRRTPLPPIDGESEPEPADDTDDDARSELSPPPSRDGRQAQFFTPEPPSSPMLEVSVDDVDKAQELEPVHGIERLPSPSVQVVGA
ncbi:hypothetical protein GQ53DRAFT_294684 [Thozetella sp. PMI_491]|nr:hypothetical protein GQ53DRAFT_294684 [Thozetella sp. PMI_491]